MNRLRKGLVQAIGGGQTLVFHAYIELNPHWVLAWYSNGKVPNAKRYFGLFKWESPSWSSKAPAGWHGLFTLKRNRRKWGTPVMSIWGAYYLNDNPPAYERITVDLTIADDDKYLEQMVDTLVAAPTTAMNITVRPPRGGSYYKELMENAADA